MSRSLLSPAAVLPRLAPFTLVYHDHVKRFYDRVKTLYRAKCQPPFTIMAHLRNKVLNVHIQINSGALVN